MFALREFCRRSHEHSGRGVSVQFQSRGYRIMVIILPCQGRDTRRIGGLPAQ